MRSHDDGQPNGDVLARIRRRRNPERHRDRSVCGEHQNQGTVLGIDGATQDRFTDNAGRSVIWKRLRILESGQSGDGTAQFFGTGKEDRVVAFAPIADGDQKISGHEISLELSSKRNLQVAHIAECDPTVDRMGGP